MDELIDVWTTKVKKCSFSKKKKKLRFDFNKICFNQTKLGLKNKNVQNGTQTMCTWHYDL